MLEPFVARRRNMNVFAYTLGRQLFLSLHSHHIFNIPSFSSTVLKLTLTLQVAIVLFVEPLYEVFQSPHFIFLVHIEQFTRFVVPRVDFDLSL